MLAHTRISLPHVFGNTRLPHCFDLCASVSLPSAFVQPSVYFRIHAVCLPCSPYVCLPSVIAHLPSLFRLCACLSSVRASRLSLLAFCVPPSVRAFHLQSWTLYSCWVSVRACVPSVSVDICNCLHSSFVCLQYVLAFMYAYIMCVCSLSVLSYHMCVFAFCDGLPYADVSFFVCLPSALPPATL